MHLRFSVIGTVAALVSFSAGQTPSSLGDLNFQAPAGWSVSQDDGSASQPAAGGEVLVNGTQLAPANRPITYRMTAVAPLRATNSLLLAPAPASFGPILTVRASGYADEIVYVLSNALPLGHR